MLEARNLLSTLTVTSAADMHQDGFLALREAVHQANHDAHHGQSDTIVFDDSLGQATITLTQGELSLSGANPNVTEAIDGAGRIAISGNNASRVLRVKPGVNANLTGLSIINGLSVINGRNSPAGGAGIRNYGSLTVSGCTLANDVCGGGPVNGGGIYNAGRATLTVSSSTFSADQTSLMGWGGAIYNAGTAMVTDTVFDGNIARLGGAVLNGSTLTISGSTFTNNSATGPGGGGGINNDLGTLTVSASTFSGNNAGRGGGIYNGATLTVTTSTFSANTANAPGDGGGVDSTGMATLTSVTVTGNRGGGVTSAGTLLLENSIVAGNYQGSTPNDISGTADPASSYNVIGIGGSGGLINGMNGNQVGVADALLGPLADNGGPTQTLALLASSTALDAGDPSLLGTPDQRGVVRTGGVNVGAYQASASAFLVAAPRRVQAGVPLDVTVTAVDPFGQLAVGYVGTVTFSTSDPDPGVVLPADYTFTLADAGVHLFTDTGLGETTLLTHGHQTISVADTVDGSITGNVTVRVRRNPPAPGPAPGRGVVTAAPVSGDLVSLLARSIRQGFGDIESLGLDRLNGADLLPI
jgi:hypothetical protein